MKENNQMAILKMAAVEFNNGDFNSRIITEDGKNLKLEITRNFIWKTTVTYTVNDIVNLALEKNGDVFHAILADISRTFMKENNEHSKNLN